MLVTGDTSGNMKAWDISGVDFDDQKTSNKFNELYFIIAHRSTINSIVIVENSNIKTGTFIVTAGNDCNILLHQLETGVRIGKFGQHKGWSINDLSKYEDVKPRYVREWYLKLKSRLHNMKLKIERERQRAKEAEE